MQDVRLIPGMEALAALAAARTETQSSKLEPPRVRCVALWTALAYNVIHFAESL